MKYGPSTSNENMAQGLQRLISELDVINSLSSDFTPMSDDDRDLLNEAATRIRELGDEES